MSHPAEPLCPVGHFDFHRRCSVNLRQRRQLGDLLGGLLGGGGFGNQYGGYGDYDNYGYSGDYGYGGFNQGYAGSYGFGGGSHERYY